ncbi:hypothetical protein HH682_11570 [Rosenbergiella sp. S61]|uniref:Uncharacterized protein n=1 Tax=Rosenbergiella gaditana TaxID=2726987 RepID=A0ABS5T0Q5_9GAMM|nr:hypothetical protein [Rosenbergiella gaditana]MBT0725042.1 hypothetical protein [Rosenbergiella gaditana]
MKKFKLKTVDVWDTILRRKCHPDFIKRSTAYYFYLKYHHLHNNYDVTALFKSRVDCELAIAKLSRDEGFDDEYHIKDVFFQWIKNNISKSVNIEDIVEDLYSWEINKEKSLTYIDPYIIDFLNENSSDETLFLSDFYISSPSIIDIIKNSDVNFPINKGITSADIRLNKRSGKLFDFLRNEHNIQSDEWLHIGDNAWSDVKIPTELGITSKLYCPDSENNLRVERESLWGNDLKLISTLTNDLTKNQKSNDIDESTLTGMKTTPFIVGFCTKILEEALRNNCKKIFFFTREGEFFIKAFEKFISEIESQMNDLKLPEFEILEVSRISTFSPSLSEISIDEMMRVWSLYSTQSISALFKTLDIDITIVHSFIDKYNLKDNEVIQYPWLDARVVSLFSDSEFKAIVWNIISEKKKLIIEYFNQKGITNNSKDSFCFVDVGWRGTIHDNIALLFPNTKFIGVYLGLQKFLNKQPENTAKFSFGPDLNIKEEYSHYLDSVAPIEMITNSPTGSVTGYVREGEKIVAQRNIDLEENKTWYNFTNKFQEGLLSCINHFTKSVLNYGLTSDKLRDYSLNIWGVLLDGSNTSLINAFNNLNHNEVFGVGSFLKKDSVPSTMDIFLSFFNRNKRLTLIDFIKQNQWGASLDSKKDITWLNKKILVVAAKFAHYYKRNFYRR